MCRSHFSQNVKAEQIYSSVPFDSILVSMTDCPYYEKTLDVPVGATLFLAVHLLPYIQIRQMLDANSVTSLQN